MEIPQEGLSERSQRHRVAFQRDLLLHAFPAPHHLRLRHMILGHSSAIRPIASFLAIFFLAFLASRP